MKMLKKLLAVVLTGAMALTLLTACGGNAVNDKSIADALNDIVKSSVAAGQTKGYTFKPRTDEQAMAKAIAALSESERHKTEKVMKILELDEDGANKNNFVWYGAAFADEIGATGQAYRMMNHILSEDAAKNKPEGKPADIRNIGTALVTMNHHDGKQTTVRIIVVTAEVDKK